MSVSIYIVEDHDIMQQVLAEFIATLDDMEVSGVAETAEQALEELGQAGADLALVDLSLPKMSGAELVHEVQERWPEISCLVLSGHGERVYVERALEAGARGYILKGDPYEIEGAIRQVLRGEIYLSEGLQKKID